jgi:hypothetical protein
MQIDRKKTLSTLKLLSIGLSAKELLEQSNCFVFSGESAVTFNSETLCRTKSPFDFDAVLIADDLIKLLEKFPDDELEIIKREAEVVIKGARRSAGLTTTAEVHLPFDSVPKPEKWLKLADGVGAMLQQAARTCGTDETQIRTTCVHITPKLIEACDNYRLFRATLDTGITEEILIPASGVKALKGLDIVRVSVGKEWAHFRTKDNLDISIRCYHDSYHQGLDKILKVEGHKIKLPDNLGEIIARAEVMQIGGNDPEITLLLEPGELTLSARKESGWFKERKKINYSGDVLTFKINPEFLIEILVQTRTVIVNEKQMKIETENIAFACVLQKNKGKEETPAEEVAVE